MVEVSVHHREVHGIVIAWPGGAGNCEQEMVREIVSAGVVVEGAAEGSEEENHVCGLCGGSRILPVDVQAVETEICEHGDAAAGEGGAAGGGGCRGGEAGGVAPAADAEEGFQVAVVFLEEVELLGAAVEVKAGGGPGVGRVVLFDVGVGITQVAGDSGEMV